MAARTQKQLELMLSELSRWLPDLAAAPQPSANSEAPDEFIERIVREVMQSLRG